MPQTMTSEEFALRKELSARALAALAVQHEAWAHEHSAEDIPCTLHEYDDVAAGVAAQSSGSHPFFVRLPERVADATGQTFWDSPSMALEAMLGKYGEARDYYATMAESHVFASLCRP